jgi:hypothetical protein
MQGVFQVLGDALAKHLAVLALKRSSLKIAQLHRPDPVPYKESNLHFSSKPSREYRDLSRHFPYPLGLSPITPISTFPPKELAAITPIC